MKRMLAAVFTPEKNDSALQTLKIALAAGSVQFINAQGEVLAFPASVHNALHYLVSILSRGQAVSVIPQVKYLSCNDAAEILGCSRPHLYKLLDEKAIPYQSVGSHRRICFEDVIAYRSSLLRSRQHQSSEIAEITIKIKNQHTNK